MIHSLPPPIIFSGLYVFFWFSVECFGEIWYIDIRKGKYPLQSGCSQGNLDVLTDTAYPVGRQDRHFYFRLFLLLRKASNAITRLPKAHNNVNMPMKIESISKAVICATVFALLRSVLNGCPLDIQHPFLCIPASRSFGVGRLPPCHGYFPMAYAMQLIYHFSRHNSTIFVNSSALIVSYFFDVCFAFLSLTISWKLVLNNW